MSVETNEAERKRVRDALQEISNAMTRIEGEREFIREAKKALVDDQLVDKKVLNRMVKVYHKQNYAEERQTDNEFQDIYEIVTGQTTLES